MKVCILPKDAFGECFRFFFGFVAIPHWWVAATVRPSMQSSRLKTKILLLTSSMRAAKQRRWPYTPHAL